jgi:hypothetical protein
LSVLKDDGRAFIFKRMHVTNSIESDICKVVATATLQNDGLFHIDDITKFLDLEGSCVPCTTIYYPNASDSITNNLNNSIALNSISKSKHMLKLLKQQSKELKILRQHNKSLIRGSSQINTRSTLVGLNPLEVLHVKLGHVGEDTIKWAVRNDSMIGLGYTYDEIKNLTLKQCPSCMEGKMEAFPIPPSITTRQYGVFEYLSVDILSWTYVSVRGYQYTALYVDKCTKHLFHYHMK